LIGKEASVLFREHYKLYMGQLECFPVLTTHAPLQNDGRRELLRKLGFGDVLAAAPAGAAPADSSAAGAPTANGNASAADRAAAGMDGLAITSDGTWVTKITPKSRVQQAG
jgi:hypothetical protein